MQGGGPLTTLGRAQITALANRLQGEDVSILYVSPTLRTRQTARILAKTRDIKLRQRNDLIDLNYGDFAGGFIDDVRRKNPGLFRQWRETPELVHFPNGESLQDLHIRVERFLDEIKVRHGDEALLIVTHDSPIRAIVASALGLGSSHHRQFLAEVGSMTVIEISGKDARLVLMNSTFHLEGIHAN